MNHFISIADCSQAQVESILQTAFRLREERQSGRPNTPVLAGKTLAMIFEKPSLRTRVSFQQAMIELGGHAINLVQGEIGLGHRESAADVVRVLNGMVQGISARVNDHRTLLELMQYSEVPVVNALSDQSHPCQALADAMTMIDAFGEDLSGRTVAYVGDGNNVAVSLAAMAVQLNYRMIVASPAGFELPAAEVAALHKRMPRLKLEATNDPQAAVADADVIYTDTWVSMGQEEESTNRLQAFEGFQVNEALLANAPTDAIVLHCLPAHRGQEITDGVMDGPQSRVFPQAHNRLHAQKGLLALLMGEA